MIDSQGWLDWAERMPGSMRKTNRNWQGNPYPNAANGIVLHSAEGYAGTLLDLAVNGPLSWHLSNLMDGRLIQHYPLTVQTWHASAANPFLIGMENEGVFSVETTLNDDQIANAVHVISDLSAWKGWIPRRPLDNEDTQHTLWEHNEVVRVGGSATACPSGRIPWGRILYALDTDPLVIVGLGAHYQDGSDEEIWTARPGKVLDGIGARHGDGSIERLWP